MTRLSIFFLAAVLLAVAATIAPPAVAQTPSEPAAGAPSRPRVGLVLSGGGARGFAHVGVLQVLQELNVPIDAIAATSMGAIIGGSYAAGRTPAALERLVRETAWNDVFAARPPRAELPHRRKEDDFDNLFSFEFGVSRDGPTLPRGVVSTQNLNVMLRGLGAHVDNVSDLGRLPIPFAAMATDLATGQLAVLQKDVTLSTALRASMSVPGAFAPVEVHGQPLVDGGLVRNLPVDVVRRMGVDVVIAVNVGTPLLPRDKLDTVLAVGEQMINILTEQNVQRSLGELQPQDILIAPDLTKFTAADFTRGDAIIAAGAAAAREVAAQLRRLGVDHAAYARFEQRRIAPVAGDGPVTIAEVQVEGLRRVSPAAVRAELDVPTDRPVERSELAAATQRVFATGDFETVDYALVDGPADSAERRRLLIRPIEKSWGYNTLRLGGSIQTDFDSINTFDILAAHTWRWLNPAGAEWRNELQFGDTQRVLTEWYQPLAPGSRWFVMPQLAFERSIVDVFVGDTRLARLRNSTRTAAVYAGYALPRLGSVRVGTGRYRFRAATLVGEPLFDDQSTDANGVGFSINLDTLDTVNYPRRGFLARFEAVALDAVSGDEVRDRISDFELQLPVTFGRYTINASARGGTSTQFGTFQLGGLFNLSGTPVGRIAGSRYALLRLLAYRNISDAFGDLPTPVYVGVSLEAGDAVERDVSLSWGRAQRAGSIYVGTDSILGPLYFALGRTAGGSSAAYLFWGRPR